MNKKNTNPATTIPSLPPATRTTYLCLMFVITQQPLQISHITPKLTGPCNKHLVPPRIHSFLKPILAQSSLTSHARTIITRFEVSIRHNELTSWIFSVKD